MFFCETCYNQECRGIRPENFGKEEIDTMSEKTILEQWRAVAYDESADKGKLQKFWASYFNIEKGIYEQLLEDPDEVVTGTVKELAEKYGQDVFTMTGFLDGINDRGEPHRGDDGRYSGQSGF